jgi:hypothetical protein
MRNLGDADCEAAGSCLKPARSISITEPQMEHPTKYPSSYSSAAEDAIQNQTKAHPSHLILPNPSLSINQVHIKLSSGEPAGTAPACHAMAI